MGTGINMSHMRARKGFSGSENLDAIRIDKVQSMHKLMEYPWTHGNIVSFYKELGIYHVFYEDGSTWEYAIENNGVSYKKCK